ncbi:YARHG domain-containing protein [Roseburia hominis]
MGFGKKKKAKKAKKEEMKSVPVKSVKVDMQHNPLYPPKQESDMQELLTAFGTTVVCVLLVVFIVSKFSYMNQVNAYGNYGNNSVTTQQNEPQDQQEDVTELEEVQEEEPEDVADTDEGTDEVTEEPEVTPEEPKENPDYIIADSNSRYVSVSELEGLSKEELSRARNEIYARHGRKFKDAGLQSYFDSKAWYSGTVNPDDFSDGMLNEYEKKNAETILSYEKSKGYK